MMVSNEKWADITDKSRVIDAALQDGVYHIIDINSTTMRTYVSYCGLKLDYNGEGLLLKQKPQDITCSACIDGFAKEIQAEIVTLTNAINVLSNRQRVCKFIVEIFGARTEMTRAEFHEVLKKTTRQKDPVVVENGKRGGKVGEPARAQKLSPERRSEIASKGGQAVKGKAGRPRTGEYRNCNDCGRGLYISRYRLERGKGVFYCGDCWGKPRGLRLVEARKKAIGDENCPKCGGRLSGPNQDGDFDCFTCGYVEYVENNVKGT